MLNCLTCVPSGLPNAVMVQPEAPVGIDEGDVLVVAGEDINGTPEKPVEILLYYGPQHTPMHPGCKSEYKRKTKEWHVRNATMISSLIEEGKIHGNVHDLPAPTNAHSTAARTTIDLPGCSLVNTIIC